MWHVKTVLNYYNVSPAISYVNAWAKNMVTWSCHMVHTGGRNRTSLDKLQKQDFKNL